MKTILFLTNNLDQTKPLLDFLQRQKNVKTILFDRKLTLDVLKKIKPDLIVSYSFSFLITQEAIDFSKGRILNLHISYLPYNRGADPNIWSILEGTPSGVTIHLVDKGLDTGDIVFQREVELSGEDTLESSYGRLQREIQRLFIANFTRIKNWQIKPRRQVGEPTFHLKKDFECFKSVIEPEGYSITISELKKRFKVLKNEN